MQLGFATDYQTILERVDAIDPLKYGRTRNYVDGDVSYLSPYISRGVISTKQVLDHVMSKGYAINQIESFVKESEHALPNEVHGYPTSTAPHNSMFDIRKKLPLFTKSEDSKSLYCAGYYTIKFEKGWVKSFCPKKITLERYPYKGPFKTEIEMKQVMANVTK